MEMLSSIERNLMKSIFLQNPESANTFIKYGLCAKSILDEDFMRKWAPYLDWELISYHQNLTEDFIEEMKDRVHWENISYRQNLSEEFMRKHVNELSWKRVSHYQKLGEQFIRQMEDKIDWEFSVDILYEKDLSFIRELKDKVHWKDLSFAGKAFFSDIDFVRENIEKLDIDDLIRIYNNSEVEKVKEEIFTYLKGKHNEH